MYLQTPLSFLLPSARALAYLLFCPLPLLTPYLSLCHSYVNHYFFPSYVLHIFPAVHTLCKSLYFFPLVFIYFLLFPLCISLSYPSIVLQSFLQTILLVNFYFLGSLARTCNVPTDRLVYQDVRGLSATESCPGLRIGSRTMPKDAGMC